MKIKKFGDKKITIRKLARKDLKAAKKFQNYINSLIKEEAKILMKNKKTEREEKEWLEERLENVKKHKSVCLLAEENNQLVGLTSVKSGRERESHVAEFGISVRWGYRGMGLGSYLMKEVIKLAKRELVPKPKIIKLGVFANNEPAINLYKKMGFKRVAKIPDQIEYEGKLIDAIIMLLYL